MFMIKCEYDARIIDITEEVYTGSKYNKFNNQQLMKNKTWFGFKDGSCFLMYLMLQL